MRMFHAILLAAMTLGACSVAETVFEAGERAPDKCWGCRPNR